MQEEHAEYVRAMASLAAFMAGFVNIAFVQFGFETRDVPYRVLMGFAISNALTVRPTNLCAGNKPCRWLNILAKGPSTAFVTGIGMRSRSEVSSRPPDRIHGGFRVV